MLFLYLPHKKNKAGEQVYIRSRHLDFRILLQLECLLQLVKLYYLNKKLNDHPNNLLIKF